MGELVTMEFICKEGHRFSNNPNNVNEFGGACCPTCQTKDFDFYREPMPMQEFIDIKQKLLEKGTIPQCIQADTKMLAQFFATIPDKKESIKPALYCYLDIDGNFENKGIVDIRHNDFDIWIRYYDDATDIEYAVGYFDPDTSEIMIKEILKNKLMDEINSKMEYYEKIRNKVGLL